METVPDEEQGRINPAVFSAKATNFHQENVSMESSDDRHSEEVEQEYDDHDSDTKMVGEEIPPSAP